MFSLLLRLRLELIAATGALCLSPAVVSATRTPLRRTYARLMTFVFVVSTTVAVIQPLMPVRAFALSDRDQAVLPDQNQQLAGKLQYNPGNGEYNYNQGYTGIGGTEATLGSGASPRITATFSKDPTKGITVSDPVNHLDLGITPQFGLGLARQSANQIMYPLTSRMGYLVYTAQVTGVKEDILLQDYQADEAIFDYTLSLPQDIQARVESDGSLGVYGSSLPLYGTVATGSAQDAKLLDTARKNSPKTKLIFTIPAPVAVETGKQVSQVKLRYELHGTHLKIVASHLKGASYPLSIDPSVYVETAAKLMRGNNETNLDFDVDNELIQKGKLSGGRFDNWLNTMNLPASRNSMGVAVAGGYVYVVGGMQGSTRVSTVYWAKFNTTTYAIGSPNPGSGPCASWCTSSLYNLPVATSGLSLVAYNGFLYVFGGQTSSGRTNAVYISKLGANGEPSLWYPGAKDMDTDKSNWVYWYKDTNLTSERTFAAAAAYNNRMYLVGGTTNTSTGGVTSVQEADINPTGTLGTWNTTGMVSLTSARRSHSIQIYNDRMYLIGGVSGSSPQSSVQYIKISNDGTMAGSWITTTPMLQARFSDGGTFSTIWGGYLYVAGGCSALTGSGGWCSVSGLSTDRDIELASINADGSLTAWTTINGLTYQRTGYGLVAWRQTLYGIGGCVTPNETNGTCVTDATTATYGRINPDGDVSTTDSSVPSGTAPCSGTSPTNCNIPPAGDSAGQGGNMASGVAVNNGYIYIIGGCTDVSYDTDCGTGGGRRTRGAMSGNISYAALAADGSLVRPPSCIDSWYGSWCVDSTNRINGTTGLGAMSVTVYNNIIYSFGGTDGTTWEDAIWEVGLNEDGSLTGAWNTQTFSRIGIGRTGYGFMYTFARANPTDNTRPGNLFIIGGCNAGSETSDGIGCASSSYFTDVYKCTIAVDGTIEESNQFDCTINGQLQLDSEPNVANAQGLGGMAGTVYANYIYLIGGTSPDESTRGEVMYAKIDNNNDIVPVSGSTWITSPNTISPARLRGTAFGYNGYLYSLAGYSGTGSLNDVLYAKIDVSDGSIGPFTTSLVTVTPRWQLGAIVANGFVYAFGGCSSGPAPNGCNAMTATIQTFQLYNNYSGTPASYSTTPNFGADRIAGSATILNGYIYYAAGCTNISCTAVTNTVYYAALSPDGSVGSWTQSPNSLPAGRSWGKLLAAGGTLYYMGGQDAAGTPQSAVYYSTPNSSGVPGGWSQASNGLPTARTQIGAAVWNNRLFVTGGYDGVSYTATVYSSPSLASGGNITSAWASTTDFIQGREGHVAIAYANNLYVLGGYDGSKYLNGAQYAKINSDGTVSGWTYTTTMPQTVYGGDGFAANGYMYVFGGQGATYSSTWWGGTTSSTYCTNNTYIAPISANTTIASGNNPTGVGSWSQTNVEFTGDRYGVAAAYDQGKAYVLGGGCTSFVPSANRTYMTTLQSQPQVAKYSRMIDTDTDVFPSKWLMNGLDNDIGARWKMKYRSSTAAAAAWGKETNFGTITLGHPENYIPLDASGVNTNFARYFYMSVTIDSSQAFGYPEDVTRGPTIADISLFFTSDPSKRLRHGATFTGGELQPLDTPF